MRVVGKIQYVRFGPIPKNGKSNIYCGEVFVGYEKGVSVYEAMELNGEFKILMPSLSEAVCVSLSGCIRREQIFLIDGDVIGAGRDGEPILKNTKVICKLSQEKNRLRKGE